MLPFDLMEKVIKKVIDGGPGKANGAVSTLRHSEGLVGWAVRWRRSGPRLRPFVE